jgi:hypothetical protein
MVKQLFGLFVVLFVVSCKTKAVVSEGNASNDLETEKIIQSHYNTKIDFNTLYIKADAHYEDAKNSQSVTAEIKIKKDEKILVSVRFLGITMAKALLSPEEVKYYDKINGKYFEGNYETLSKWLGTNLDYFKVQNLLIGQPLDDLKNKKYTNSIVDKLYRLFAKENNIDKSYYFEAERFLLKKQELSQPEKRRTLTVNYPNFQEIEKAIVPSSIEIDANDAKSKTSISIDYKTVNVNEEFSFPYTVPEGYERINID